MENQLEIIKSKIYEIRGQRVMLDNDLADLYGTETKYLKRSVKSNLRRFPSDFMFELTKEEWDALRCKNCTSKRGGTRYLPYAFTELGVAMLSSVLNSQLAIDVNIKIMRAFVALRQALSNPPAVDRVGELEKQVQDLRQYIEEVFADYNDINEDTSVQLELINKTLAELQAKKKAEEKPRNKIGFRK